MKRIVSDKIILGNRLFDGYIYFEDGIISAVTADELQFSDEYDARGCYVSAGFIDIHTHGGGGYPFDGTTDDVINACNFHLKHGTTSICPTLAAAPFAQMAGSVERVEAAMSDPRLMGTIIGTHLEGPYLSPKQCGAQCTEFMSEPKAEEYLPLIEKHKNAIALWCYAPENDKDGKFAQNLTERGIVVSAGHTDAIYTDMLKAMDNGCHLTTHLYSCTSTITRDHGFRRLGVIETAFLHDEMFVEIICDGKHLPPELIKLIYKIKGADRITLVTDSLAIAGTDATHGKLLNTEFIIEDGVCKLADRSAFAGSIATADRLVRVAVKEAEIPIFDAVKMITATPAAIMGLKNKGEIAEGKDADFVVFDNDITVKRVFAKGNEVS